MENTITGVRLPSGPRPAKSCWASQSYFVAGPAGQPQFCTNVVIKYQMLPHVYDMVEDCLDYDSVVKTLAKLYIKTPNVFFASHCHATRHQQRGEPLVKYLIQPSEADSSPESTSAAASGHSKGPEPCYFCGGAYNHSRSTFPARNAFCGTCGVKGV